MPVPHKTEKKKKKWKSPESLEATANSLKLPPHTSDCPSPAWRAGRLGPGRCPDWCRRAGRRTETCDTRSRSRASQGRALAQQWAETKIYRLIFFLFSPFLFFIQRAALRSPKADSVSHSVCRWLSVGCKVFLSGCLFPSNDCSFPKTKFGKQIKSKRTRKFDPSLCLLYRSRRCRIGGFAHSSSLTDDAPLNKVFG